MGKCLAYLQRVVDDVHGSDRLAALGVLSVVSGIRRVTLADDLLLVIVSRRLNNARNVVRGRHCGDGGLLWSK